MWWCLKSPTPRRFHRASVDSIHNEPVIWKAFRCRDVIMCSGFHVIHPTTRNDMKTFRVIAVIYPGYSHETFLASSDIACFMPGRFRDHNKINMKNITLPGMNWWLHCSHGSAWTLGTKGSWTKAICDCTYRPFDGRAPTSNTQYWVDQSNMAPLPCMWMINPTAPRMTLSPHIVRITGKTVHNPRTRNYTNTILSTSDEIYGCATDVNILWPCSMFHFIVPAFTTFFTTIVLNKQHSIHYFHIRIENNFQNIF